VGTFQLAIVAQGTSPLAERAGNAKIRRVPGELVPSFWRADLMILLEDRVLLLGNESGWLATAVHWLR
jgi:hypothetical protein